MTELAGFHHAAPTLGDPKASVARHRSAFAFTFAFAFDGMALSLSWERG